MPERFRHLAIVASLAVWMVLGAGCGKQSAPSQSSGSQPGALVTAGIVESLQWQDEIQALGTAQANESVTLTAKVTETVTRINFEDGDFVEAGAVLVDLSGRAEVAQLEAAQATFVETSKQHDRLVELVKQGTIPRSQLDTQVAIRDAARARANAIRAALADRIISAPFSGVLGFRRVSPGALVTPGSVITTLDDISIIKLDFAVPEGFLSLLQTGQAIRATSTSFPDQVFVGRVSAIGSRVDPLTRAVPVRAEIPNPDAILHPGMLLSVRLLQAPRQTLVVPEIAVVQVGARAFLFRLDEDNTAHQVEVVLGARRRGEVEVLAGLAAGDRIVVDGTVKLRDGAKVRFASMDLAK